MDIDHVELVHKLEDTGSLNIKGISKASVIDDTGSIPPSIAEVAETSQMTEPTQMPDATQMPETAQPFSSTNVDTGPDFASLLVINTSQPQNVSADSDTKVKARSFRSLPAYGLQREQCDGECATDKSISMKLTATNAETGLSHSINATSLNASSTKVPVGLIHGYFTLPLNTTISSMVGIKLKPYKSHTYSLYPTVGLGNAARISPPVQGTESESPQMGSPQSDSPHSGALTITPDPCQGLKSGPRDPPHPADSYHPVRKATPAIFHDQFTQFMEDRMVMFRPTSSQNNVDQSLNYNHPYQQANEVDTVLLRGWFTSNPNRNSIARVSPDIEPTPRVSADSPTSVLPANNSTSSFLPRGVQGPYSAEPRNSTMVYTPRAIPLRDVKRPPVSPIASQCSCLWWPF